MNTCIWRSNQNMWNYVKRLIFGKFAECGLQLYYQGAPLQLFRKDKGYTLHSFLRICRATILFEIISHVYFSMYLSYIFPKGRWLSIKQLNFRGQQYKNQNWCPSSVFSANFEHILCRCVANFIITFQNNKVK